jgi:hypothetical protein
MSLSWLSNEQKYEQFKKVGIKTARNKIRKTNNNFASHVGVILIFKKVEFKKLIEYNSKSTTTHQTLIGIELWKSPIWLKCQLSKDAIHATAVTLNATWHTSNRRRRTVPPRHIAGPLTTNWITNEGRVCKSVWRKRSRYQRPTEKSARKGYCVLAQVADTLPPLEFLLSRWFASKINGFGFHLIVVFLYGTKIEVLVLVLASHM